MYVPITNTNPILYHLLVSDSFNKNRHFFNNNIIKALNDAIITRNDIITTLTCTCITISVTSFRSNR